MFVKLTPFMRAATVNPPTLFGHLSQRQIPFSSKEFSGSKYPTSPSAFLHFPVKYYLLIYIRIRQFKLVFYVFSAMHFNL